MLAQQNRGDASEASAPSRAPLVGLTMLGLVVIAVNAWLCDDAFITLRSARNLVEGHGPVFNLGWRVQSYTHPAWMLILALAWALTREAFWTTIVVGLAVSGFALALGLRHCERVSGQWRGAVVFVVALSCSRAFVEYSTSGLENPLTHLILVGAAALLGQREAPRRQLLVGGLLVSAAFLSRPDAVLLLAPVWVELDRRARAAGLTRRQRAAAWIGGAAPALAWELSSLVYYGALLPNTALVKLGLDIDRSELVSRGLTYLWRAVTTDPVTATLIVAALVLPWLPVRARTSSLRPLARGAAAYLIYVVAIGGDFMEGRFLTAPALCGALALGQLRCSGRGALAIVGAIIVIAGFGARHPWLPDAGSEHETPRSTDGISDERAHYAASASALAWRPGRSMPDHPWRELGERGPEDGARVVLFSTMGYYGFFADPRLHVVDRFALADPLLARIPPVRRVDWKAGHLPRIMPEGYLESLAGEPWQLELEDPAVARLYESVLRVHHGPVLARGRAAAIVELLSGRASEDIDYQRYALAELVHVDARALARRRRSLRFRDAGVEIRYPKQTDGPGSLRLRLSPGQRYALVFRVGDAEVARRELELTGEPDGPPQLVEVDAPQRFDRVHVLPLTMHGKRSLELGGGPDQ